MKESKKYLIGGIIATALIFASIFVGVQNNKNQNTVGLAILSTHSACKTAPATSTLSVMAASTSANIVLTCDAYNMDNSNPNATPMDSSALAIQYTAASSTASQMTVVVNYSNDGIDWYKNYLEGDAIATTSVVLTNSSTSSTKYLYNVLTPTRYVRATFSNSASIVATSSVWAEFIPKKI
jgi:hypothetical protein